MRSREYRTAVFVGLASGVLWFFVLKHLAIASALELAAVILAVPAAFMGVIALVHRFPRVRILHGAAKFLMVGVLNTGIDFFLFDTLIVLTGIDTGGMLILFKSLSFICALLNSYELNRLWTFEGSAGARRTRSEFISFAIITAGGFLVNIGVTVALANAIQTPFGLTRIRWDNVAAAAATVFNLIWNYAGYHLFVFNAKDNHSSIASPHVI